MRTVPTWFIPSFYGDIKLEADGDDRTIVIATDTTIEERKALETVAVKAHKKRWIETPEIRASGGTLVAAPIDKVAGMLSRALKPGRKVVSAVLFKDGTMEEVRTAPSSSQPYREPAAPAVKDPAVATSVAAPVIGCPAPDFGAAQLRARAVLLAFLDPDQAEDFQRHNRFISVGATTGHRYMITSRNARDELAQWQRSLYDLDEDRALCVHDWSVPAAEEMLALHVCLRLPGWEHFVRDIPEHGDLPNHVQSLLGPRDQIAYDGNGGIYVCTPDEDLV